jgi:hypothetical protein
MEPFYQPNDPTATERENKKWRDAAGYDLAENLVFQLKDESLPDLIEAHAKSWHISAVWSFHIREADRGDGKYPWTSLETKLDNVVRSRFTPVRRVTLPGVLAAGLAAYSFDCVGRLIRRYTPQNDDGGGLGIHGPKLGRRPRFAALALPIPTPAQDARRTMERFRESVRDAFFSQLDAGPATRQFLAERLGHARTIVTTGARLNDALAYRSGPCKLTPADVGNLLGSIEYFRRCWEDFHKAEKPTAPLPGELTALIPGLTHCRPGYIDTVLDNALAERKAASDNAADWFKFIDLVSYNAEKLPLDPERRAWVIRWASGAKSDLNRLLSGPQVPVAEQTDPAALTARLQHLTGTTRRILARGAATLSGFDPASVARNDEEISRIEQQLNELENLQPIDPPAPASPRPELPEKPQQRPENLLDKLCGGYKAEQLLKVIGNDGLGLYNATDKRPNDTAKSTEWAILYWGLQYKGFLPAGLSNDKASKLLKTTFGAKSSKTHIGYTKPNLSEKPKNGTYLARVVDLLSGSPT